MPAAEQSAEQGGGVAEAIVKVDEMLAKIAAASAENPEVSDGAKQAIAASLDAFRAFSEQLTGGGEAPAAAGQVPADAGARGVPMTHGRPA